MFSQLTWTSCKLVYHGHRMLRLCTVSLLCLSFHPLCCHNQFDNVAMCRCESQNLKSVLCCILVLNYSCKPSLYLALRRNTMNCIKVENNTFSNALFVHILGSEIIVPASCILSCDWQKTKMNRWVEDMHIAMKLIQIHTVRK